MTNQLDKEKTKAYIGFDCTAESLHVGSLLQIMCLRLFQKHGHQPIVLLGGGTTRSEILQVKIKQGKFYQRVKLKRIQKILKNFKKYLETKIKTKPIFVNNFSWLKNLNYISFLRDMENILQ